MIPESTRSVGLATASSKPALISSFLLSKFSLLLSSSILFLFASQAQICAAELLVAAAADMAPLEQPLAKAFERESGDRLRFSFGSSGMLARQVGHGAPFDVYLSANEQFVHDLARSGRLLPDSVRVYAPGWPGLWTKGNRAARLEDMLSLARIAIPNPVHAPYGVAARQALARTGLGKNWNRGLSTARMSGRRYSTPKAAMPAPPSPRGRWCSAAAVSGRRS